MHIELFLEEPSAEAFLQGLLSKLVPGGTTWNPIVFQGKTDLLGNLERRLKGYKSWMPDDWKIVVLIDEDRANCRELKARMEAASAAAGFLTKTAANGGKFDRIIFVVLGEYPVGRTVQIHFQQQTGFA